MGGAALLLPIGLCCGLNVAMLRSRWILRGAGKSAKDCQMGVQTKVTQRNSVPLMNLWKTSGHTMPWPMWYGGTRFFVVWMVWMSIAQLSLVLVGADT